MTEGSAGPALFARLADIVAKVSFKPWRFLVQWEGNNFFLCIEADEVCNVTGEPITWRSRKWRLSPHMTDGEVVQTAFLAAKTAMEHEMREKFTYKGVTVFDPHYDIDKLVELRSSPGSIKGRTAP